MEQKELEVKLSGLEASIKTFVDKAEAELKNAGNVSAETKAALEAQATQAKDIMNRLLGVEQKLVGGINNGGDDRIVKSVGDLFIESDGFKAFKASGRGSYKVNVGDMWKAEKTALINATGQNQPLVQALRVPGIVTPAMQPLRVRDVFNALPTSSNLIEYVRESSFTNNAALQGVGSSPQVYENVAKAESAAAFELLFQPVHTVAHWMPISKQLIADSPALAGYVNTRLRYGLKLKEETELMVGTGTGASIKGLIPSATAYDTGRDVASPADTMIDTISHAGTQVEASFYPWEFTILNPADVEKINLIKTTGTASSGEYVASDPRAAGQSTLWGRPIVKSFSMTAGKFLVGSSMAATIWDRADATVEVSYEHSDFFVKNMAAVLCEERFGLTVEVPAALIYGDFPQF
jgi:HK97 family phage major capsid protein